jgi:DNA-binding NarL/FixJ family response regulator
MHGFGASAQTQRVKMGGPLGVVLVVDTAPLLLRMREVVQGMPQLRLAGAFRTEEQLLEWAMWDRQGFHLAFVDMGLAEGRWTDVVRKLQAQPRPGRVVALGAHLWKEVREECATHGVYDLLEKGDLAAFRGFLEEEVR